MTMRTSWPLPETGLPPRPLKTLGSLVDANLAPLQRLENRQFVIVGSQLPGLVCLNRLFRTPGLDGFAEVRVLSSVGGRGCRRTSIGRGRGSLRGRLHGGTPRYAVRLLYTSEDADE